MERSIGEYLGKGSAGNGSGNALKQVPSIEDLGGDVGVRLLEGGNHRRGRVRTKDGGDARSDKCG